MQEKLEMIKQGVDRYTLEEGKVILKPHPKLKSKFKKLLKAEKGYYFLDNDIHWPEKIDEGGLTWQTEYE